MKKLPVRLCLGCNEPRTKKELIRIVKNNEGDISVDFNGKKPGRGAYICHNAECLAKVQKNKRLSRSFKCQIPDDVFSQLKKELEYEG